jgi:hypothetical protein
MIGETSVARDAAIIVEAPSEFVEMAGEIAG